MTNFHDKKAFTLKGVFFYSLPFKFSVSNVTIEIVNQIEQHKHIRREKLQTKSDDFTILLNKNVSYSF
jgi:hypothetical protein